MQIVCSNHFDKQKFEMRSLNLDQLRTLLEVIELGSFSAAARRLNLTQPAVSQHIRELERRFGVRLIERMGKQAHATAPGTPPTWTTANRFAPRIKSGAGFRRKML